MKLQAIHLSLLQASQMHDEEQVVPHLSNNTSARTHTHTRHTQMDMRDRDHTMHTKQARQRATHDDLPCQLTKWSLAMWSLKPRALSNSCRSMWQMKQ